MGGGQSKDGKAFRNVALHPKGEFGSGGGVGLNEVFEASRGGGEIGAEEDGANVGGDFGPQIESGDEGLGVLLKVKLAALPGDGGKDGGSGGGETGMGVTDDVGKAVKAARLERGKEGAPMDLGLTESDADAEDRPFAIKADADGNEDGAVEKLAALANLLVTGIKDEVRTGLKRAFAPGLKFAIELGGTGADLGRADGMAAKFLDDFGNLAGGNALDIHLGEGEHEGLLAANAFFQRTGIKIHAVANLGDAKLDGADAGGKSLGFEAVGATQTGFAAFVRAGLEDGGTFLNHGLVDEQTEAFGKSAGAFGGQKLQNGGQKIRIKLVGHVWGFCWMCLATPQQETTLARSPRAWRKPHPGPAALRLATLASTPSAPDGAFRSEAQLQKNFYTPQAMSARSRFSIVPPYQSAW